MPDEPVAPAAEPVSTPTAEPTSVPTAEPVSTPTAEPAPVLSGIDFHKVIGPDGKLLDGWKETLPEELRHEQALDMIVDFPGAIKQTVNAQKMIGANKISLPGENAPQSEVDAFQIALGRPETKEGYEVNIPEGFEDVFDVEATKEAAFAFGFPQKTLDSIMEFRSKEVAAENAANDAAEKLAFETAERIIVAQAGEALEEQQHLANVLISNNVPEKVNMPDGETITGDEYKEKLLEALNDNALRPYVFNFLANIQRDTFGQHGGIPSSDGPASGAMTPGMMEARANEIMNITGYATGELKNTNPIEYKRLTEERTDLYNRIEKAKNAAQ